MKRQKKRAASKSRKPDYELYDYGKHLEEIWEEACKKTERTGRCKTYLYRDGRRLEIFEGQGMMLAKWNER